jgi:hypothetical protein
MNQFNSKRFKKDLEQFLAVLESPLFSARHEAYSRKRGPIAQNMVLRFRAYRKTYLILRVFVTIIKSLINLLRCKYFSSNSKHGSPKVMCFAPSKNNFIVSTKLSDMLDVDVKIIRNTYELKYQLSLFSAFAIWLASFADMVILAARYLKHDLQHYIEAPTAFYYSFYYRLFNMVDLDSVELVCFPNDHSDTPVAFRDVCNAKRIKTFYIQHSFINENWPRLKYTFALLESRFAKNTHENKIGSTCDIYAVGNFYTMGKSRSIKRLKKVKSIGIAVAQSTLIFKLKNILKQLHDIDSEYIFILRQHPSMEVSIFKKLLVGEPYWNRLIFNDASCSSMETFVEQINVLIAGNSNILIEDILLGIPSLYCRDLDEATYDYHGFVKEHIVNELDFTKSIEAQIEPYYADDYKKLLGYFDASYLKPLTTIKNNVNEIINSYVS